jgi:hypothetical protein
MEQSVQCRLPSFPNPASRSADSKTSASVPVSLPDHDLDLLKSAYTTAAVTDAILIKAFAIALRCYIGSDDISLGYQTEGEVERLQRYPPRGVTLITSTLSHSTQSSCARSKRKMSTLHQKPFPGTAVSASASRTISVAPRSAWNTGATKCPLDMSHVWLKF